MTAVMMVARAELRRAWRSFVVLGVLAGLTGGIVLAVLQVARRTSTAQARLEVAAAVPDAAVIDSIGDGAPVATLPGVRAAWIAHQGVAQVRTEGVRYTSVIAGDDAPPPGLFHALVTTGRRADPAVADEVVISEAFRDVSGYDVGDSLDLAFLTRAEVRQFDTGFGAPDSPKRTVKVVGIVRTALDAGTNTPSMFGTPALARVIAPDSDAATTIFVRLADGVHGVPAFERAVEALPRPTSPSNGEQEFPPYQVVVPSAQRPVIAVTARVLIAGLLAFAAIAALAGLLGVALALRRQVVAFATDAATTRALGMVGRQARLARIVSMGPFLLSASLAATLVTLALAGLDPIGSFARREPHPGWHPNLALLAAGMVVFVVLLGLIVLFASRRRPRPRARRHTGLITRATRGAAPVVRVGTTFALDPGAGRATVPVRSALAGTVVAVAGMVAVVLFASSLTRTVDAPARWGWVAHAQVVDVKAGELERLRSDARVDRVTRVDEAQVVVSGQTTNAAAFTPTRGLLTWTVLDGRIPERPGEVLLGPRLRDALDTDIGRIVTFEKGGRKLPYRVVGIGTGPNTNNNQFGSDVVVTPTDLEAVRITEPFSAAAFTVAPGVDPRAVLDDYGRTVELSTPFRPADVDNLAQLGALPELLVAFLAVVAIAVLGNLLTTATRRRRHELDVLAALGLVPRQVRGVIVTAALAMVGVGVVLGVPLGFVAGRWAWIRTADAVFVPTDLASPGRTVIVVVVATLVAGALVAAWPAWRVGRGPVADGLREE